MTAWFSSTGISHLDLLPHIPSIHLSAVNSSSHPGIAPQSLNSSSQLLCLPGDQHSCPGYAGLRQRLSDSHSIYAVTDQPSFAVYQGSSCILPSFSGDCLFLHGNQSVKLLKPCLTHNVRTLSLGTCACLIISINLA